MSTRAATTVGKRSLRSRVKQVEEPVIEPEEDEEEIDSEDGEEEEESDSVEEEDDEDEESPNQKNKNKKTHVCSTCNKSFGAKSDLQVIIHRFN